MHITKPSHYRWHVAEMDYRLSAELGRALHMPPLIAHLLRRRGIETPGDARQYFHPAPAQLSDPLQLQGMERAVARIQRAKDSNEHVRVFGDYDVDGITGTVLLVNALKRFGLTVVSYGLPHRMEDGYGLNPAQVDEAHTDGVHLLITVDNGIKATEAAERAHELGIDLIITDHHTPPETLPRAHAIVNPRLESPSHPAYDAAGSAVAFKLAWALTGEMRDWDLVAMGIVADVVPLQGENRIMVQIGLDRLRENPRPGVKKLAHAAGVKLKEVTAEKVAFYLAPRINAGGRLGDATRGLWLLLAGTEEEAASLAQDLEEANNARRAMEGRILDEAMEQFEADGHAYPHSIVLAKAGWHPGVLGIVAARLQRRFYRPVVLIGLDHNGTGKGSGRSIPEVDMNSALAGCEDCLVRFGGHHAAAGLTIDEARIEAFRARFDEAARQQLNGSTPAPSLPIDAMTSLSQIDPALLQAIEAMQPFGHGNPSPVFCANQVELVPNSLREMRGGHIRLAVREGPALFQAVGFNMGSKLPELTGAQAVDIAFCPAFDTYRGDHSIQLMLKDIRLANA